MALPASLMASAGGGMTGGASGPATSGASTNAGNQTVIQTGGGNRNSAMPTWAWVAIGVAAAAALGGTAWVVLRKPGKG